MAQTTRKMRDMTRENLFERWLEDVVRAAGPYEDYETFSEFSERIQKEEQHQDAEGDG